MMDIFNKPPSIAEDTLQYTICPRDTSDKAFVTALATSISTFIDTVLQDFIWNRDGFEVKVEKDLENGGLWLLEGRMRVGDCVDDEWCTVWLLKEISDRWDVVISVLDSDGQFLLIEAAEALPSWVTPTNSENRVWIHRSRLHLIPLTHTSSSSTKRHHRKLPGASESEDDELEGGEKNETFISIIDACQLIRDSETATFAPPPVETLVWRRVSEYPSALKDHIHCTKAYIPEDIAKALAENPALIQRGVETFYTRDALQLRTAHRMSRFPPNTSVLASVRMTRTAYAQLSGQRFFPPKIFGQWKELEGSNQWRWKDIGMKIAVGFEMLYQESKGRRNVNNSSPEGIQAFVQAQKETLQRDPEYQQYMKKLTSSGYFKNEKQGSILWSQLEGKAASAFTSSKRANDASRLPFATQVDIAISSQSASIHPLDKGEDSDSWLNIDAEGFDQMLEQTFHSRGKVPDSAPRPMDVDGEQNTEDQVATEQAKRLKVLASKVEDFIGGEGDLEGAEFEDDVLSDAAFSEDDNDENTDDSDNEPPMLSAGGPRSPEQQDAMDKLVLALDPREYGKMPPRFHANSQRVAPTAGPDCVDDILPSLEDKPRPQLSSKDKSNGRPVRAPIIPRDKYDGVDSDDETDPEDEEIDDDDDDDERPQVVGDIEIDMGEEEEEFLEFSRQALGISDEQWAWIVKDREDRGAFLPQSVLRSSQKMPRNNASELPTEPSNPQNSQLPKHNSKPKANPELNSFEAVMNALDAVLADNKTSTTPSNPSSIPTQFNHRLPGSERGKGKQMASIEEEMVTDDEHNMDDDFDVDAAMEAELKAALQVDDDGEASQDTDYNLIKNFLESFKSQGGLSGPVSNLSGMLAPDLKFPRDNS
ncbi:SGT1 protein-domain-containing protein [Crepidotus variabilis]|uniref:SGT1 protein-domain-containing protein n=1 Tax=Crepidotus variabilis TaxID=179855 RepID=A0A9P6ESS7_9AGAR|nr:SGT1 protein-domain-containing protein [Crepidotus variabilis]